MSPNTIISAELKAIEAKNPGSVFGSREWKSWAACRRPKNEVWDERRKLAAKVQRTLGGLFRVHYAYFVLKERSPIAIDFLDAGDFADVQALEAKARETMMSGDVRLSI